MARYQNEEDQEIADVIRILHSAEDENLEDLVANPRTRKKLIKIFLRKGYLSEILEEIPTEELLECMSAIDVYKGLSPEQLTKLARLMTQPPDAN